MSSHTAGPLFYHSIDPSVRSSPTDATDSELRPSAISDLVASTFNLDRVIGDVAPHPILDSPPDNYVVNLHFFVAEMRFNDPVTSLRVTDYISNSPSLYRLFPVNPAGNLAISNIKVRP